MKDKILILIVLLFTTTVFSQSYSWFPSGFNVKPFTANILEPNAGFLISTDKNQLQLDISTSKDIILWYDSGTFISLGADLFTFTRLRSTDDFKFPVETIDYLFGINAGYKKSIKNNMEYGFRFRLSHISTHLVDGQYDAQSQKWRNGKDPFVYSKEFIELFPYVSIDFFRTYFGFTYNFHVIPGEIKKLNLNFGLEFYFTDLINEYLTPFIAYDFRLNGYDSYYGNNNIQLGINLDKSKSEFMPGGINLYFSFFAGKSMHGQYYDLTEKYSSIGLNFRL